MGCYSCQRPASTITLIITLLYFIFLCLAFLPCLLKHTYFSMEQKEQGISTTYEHGGLLLHIFHL